MGIFSRKSSKRASFGENKNCNHHSSSSNHNRHDNDDQRRASTHSSALGAPTVMATASLHGGSDVPSSSIPTIPLPPAPDPSVDPVAYLRSIYAVRERSRLVLDRAKKNQLIHFDVDMAKFADTAQYVVSIIKRDFEPNYSRIPPHGRWQHFNVGGRPRVEQLMQTWPAQLDARERTRRLIDLFLVSVLLDAGAGTKWQYRSRKTGELFRRSEGLAVASLEMFTAGAFSSDPDQPFQVDSAGVKRLTPESMADGLQVTPENPIAGLDGRTNLLIRLGDALLNRDIFGPDARPGNLLDHLLAHPATHASSGTHVVPLPTLWDTLMRGLAGIWPDTRTQINGVSLGDAWPCAAMPTGPAAWEAIVPFHKLTQWLTYSLMVPMETLAGVHFAGAALLTGLPEYRNGGLLVDTGLLTLKPADARRGIEQYRQNALRHGQPHVEVVPLFPVDDDIIVEWRALTVGFLDDLLVEVNRLLGLTGEDRLSLAQMLEAGSWKGGRELAEVSRPNTREPPIMILSDGTVF